ISSIKRIVLPNVFAFAITSLTSLTPELTALSTKKEAFTLLAIIWAKVVFPTPGGPQKIMEGRLPLLITVLNIPSGPTKCSWPVTSSHIIGLTLSANGDCAFTISLYLKGVFVKNALDTRCKLLKTVSCTFNIPLIYLQQTKQQIQHSY